MKRALVVANWKMNPQSEAEALELFGEAWNAGKKAEHVEVVVAPPFPYLASISKRWNIEFSNARGETPVALGAQDVFWEREGAFTGEISPPMEKEFGVTHVIIGHSERRRIMGETNQMVNLKLRRAFESGLRPILCVGEAEREGNEIEEFLRGELLESIENLPGLFLESLIVAYEPVWAIGSGRPDTPSDMQKVAIYLRRLLAESYGEGCANRARILYGGSVTSKNARPFFSETDGQVNGLLVGGDSLTSDFPLIVDSVESFFA